MHKQLLIVLASTVSIGSCSQEPTGPTDLGAAGAVTTTTASDGGAPSDGGSGAGGVTSSNTATGGSSPSDSGNSTATGGSAAASTSNGSIGCDRTGLEAAVDAYLSAIQAGSYTSLPLTSSAKYVENDQATSFGQGIWATALKPDFHRNLLDVEACASFTEIIITDASHPYVLGVRLKITGSEISEVYAIVTDEGDWLFNAANYLKYSEAEDWSEVPTDQRLTRQELKDAGYAYFAYWGDKTVQVPWGTPCARLEGGAYTGGGANSSCNVGIPDQGFAPQPREFLADPETGQVVLFLNLGGTDSHLFRVLQTGIRYVHTLTVQ